MRFILSTEVDVTLTQVASCCDQLRSFIQRYHCYFYRPQTKFGCKVTFLHLSVCPGGRGLGAGVPLDPGVCVLLGRGEGRALGPGIGGVPLGPGCVCVPLGPWGSLGHPLWTHTFPDTHTPHPRSTSGRYASYWSAFFSFAITKLNP